MTWLNALDHSFFQLINTGLSNPVFDWLCPLLREKLFWAPFYLFVAAFSVVNFGRKGWFVVLGVVVAAGLSDMTSNRLVKKNVQRLRPCNEPEFRETVRLRVECGSGYSFTSNHAANHFAVAVFLVGVFGRLSRRVRPMLLIWAGAVAFSQVYVGVHFPADVLVGGLLGAAIGWWTAVTFRRRGWLPAIALSH